MTNTAPMDLTWGNQSFDRSSDTISIFRINSDETKKVAYNYFESAMKPINYPAHSGGSQLHGTFRHGKYRTEDGEYILVRNVGTFRGSNVRYGAVIVRTRARGALIQIDSKVSTDKRAVHKGEVPTITIRGDIISKEKAEDLGLLTKFTKKERWHIFEEDSVDKAFTIQKHRMSDQTEAPTMQIFKTKTGTKTIAVAPRAKRSIRVRKTK